MEEPAPGRHIDVVLSKLSGVKKQGRGFVARCPAHDDHDPSLSIAEGRSGVLLWCWAGCDTREIVEAAGLTWNEMFYDTKTRMEPGRRAAPVPKRSLMIEARSAADRLQRDPEILERLGRQRGFAKEALRRMGVGWDGERLTLPVTNAKGELHDVLRYDPFKGGKWKMLAGKGKSRLPWPPPEKVDPPAYPWPLLVVEGEGTAISLMSCGILAVALPGAVSRPTGDFRNPGRFRGVGWHQSWCARFGKFKELALFPDDDESGRTLMNTVAADLEIRAYKYVYVDLELGDGNDLGDVAAWARNRDDRVTLKSLILTAIETQRAAPNQMGDARALVHAWWDGQKNAASDGNM